MAWTDEMQAELVRLAREGLTGKEIGERLGKSREAVIGRANRSGVELPLTERKKAKMRDGATAWRAANPDEVQRITARAWKAHAKLSEADVIDIHRRIAAGEKQAAIAAHFGINPAAVTLIKTGRRWPHLALQTPAKEREREGV